MPSRIKGHNGSTVLSVDWDSLVDSCGKHVETVTGLRVSDYRRLDLLASLFCRGKKHTLRDVLDSERVERLNQVGFSGCSESTIEHGRCLAGNVDGLLLRIIAQAESKIVERERLAELAEKFADTIRAGFGVVLKTGLTQLEQSSLLGISLATYKRDLSGIRAVLSQT